MTKNVINVSSELGEHADSRAGGEERTRGPRGEGPQGGRVQRRGKMSSFHDATKLKNFHDCAGNSPKKL